MAVDGVNNANSNTGLYAGSAAVVGGGAGAAYGYFSKPFLKNNEPTDSFIKQVGQNMVKIVPEEAANSINEIAKQANNAKTVEELKTNMITSLRQVFADADIEDAKASIKMAAEMAEAAGVNDVSKAEIESIKNVDDIINLFSKNFDEKYAGKTIEQIREMSKAESDNLLKNSVKSLFNQMWDADKKQFVKIESDGTPLGDYAVSVRNAVVDAANKIKGKTAAIYGLIGAAVLGLGTLVACMATNKSEKAPEEADVVAGANDLKNEEA